MTFGPHRDGTGHELRLPSLRGLVRHALPSLIEGVAGPFVVFYVILLLAGFSGALIAGLSWCLLGVLRRVVRHEEIPGTLVISTLLIIGRTVVGLVTHSTFLYFVQPSLGTALVAVLFLGSALLRRPLTERLARDFAPLHPELLARPFMRRFFLKISLLWAVVLLVNAGFVIWLLLVSSIRVFVVEKTLVTWALTLGGIVLSTMWFVRAVRGEGVTVHIGKWKLVDGRAGTGD